MKNSPIDSHGNRLTGATLANGRKVMIPTAIALKLGRMAEGRCETHPSQPRECCPMCALEARCAPSECEGCHEALPLSAYRVTWADRVEERVMYCADCADSAVGDGNMMGGALSIEHVGR